VIETKFSARSMHMIAGLSVEIAAVFRIGRLSKRRSCSAGRKKAGPPFGGPALNHGCCRKLLLELPPEIPAEHDGPRAEKHHGSRLGDRVIRAGFINYKILTHSICVGNKCNYELCRTQSSIPTKNHHVREALLYLTQTLIFVFIRLPHKTR